jgi:von Willebrand factor type A domain
MHALIPLLFLAVLPAVRPTPARVTPVTARPAAAPRIEVAFVLDTTGSMGGLIDGAKRKIWSIARRIGEGRPRPDVRIALVGYRDLSDEYVTRVHDFSRDMDEVHERLMAFQANGGGDTPEHVSAALGAAVDRLSWSEGQALRVVFLVGDAPPHLDYQDGHDYAAYARTARRRGIAIETIQCGGDPQTARVWQEIAGLGDGHYARIDAQGGMPALVTPVDAELARLNAELTTTVVASGSAAERAKTSRRLESRAAMPAAMAAEAAGYFAGAARQAERDLVSLSPEAQTKELRALADRPAEAPKAIAGKSDADALAYLKDQKTKRERVQQQIGVLQKQREDYLAKTAPAADGFDEQVVEALREQAARQGIKF